TYTFTPKRALDSTTSIVRAPNPKDAHITKAMALAVQIDTALVEMLMDVPVIRIAHLCQHVRIIVHDGLQNLGGGFSATPACHIPVCLRRCTTWPESRPNPSAGPLTLSSASIRVIF